MSETRRSEHTPGPWSIRDHRKDEECLYIESAHDGIASVFTGTLTPEDVIDANARLIAAAPELLGALKEAIRDCPCSLKERDSGHLVDCFAPRAIAAIAKAEAR